MMNPQIPVRAKTQRRKAEGRKHYGSLACAQSHSQSTPPPGFASLRLYTNFLLVISTLLFALLTGSVTAAAQEVADTIRIRTRVVFMDALVKDRRTGMPIADLSLENFQVLDDGKPRPITYFTREGQGRKPLALILILDLRDDGAGRFLKRAEILKAMEDELAKLPKEDEVAIMAMNINGEDEKRVWLTEFTNDRAKLAAALSRVPEFINLPPERADAKAAAAKPKNDQQQSSDSPTIASDSPKATSKSTAQDKPPSAEVVETETIKGKNGAVVTRTTRKDGSIDVKRVNKKGDVTIQLDDIYDMAAAVREGSHLAEQKRPNSQATIVWVSDGIAPIFFEDRDATEQILIRSNVIFNSLTVELRTLFKFLLPIGQPVAGWLGVSLYGSAKRLAQQSGGEAVKVSRVNDYGAGLSKIIGNLTARYSLGFALDVEENDDGRMHDLDVRVSAQDAKGKTRKLQVSARRGYYMSSAGEEKSAARVQ